jgi:hypothetical protein
MAPGLQGIKKSRQSSLAVAGFDVKFMSLLPYDSKQRLKQNQTYGISACAAQL